MKRRLLHLFILLDSVLLLTSCSNPRSASPSGPTPGTIVSGGDVSGTWIKGDSPFYIRGYIAVQHGQTLTIEPGVYVIFEGLYEFSVYGRLQALGEAGDSIYMVAVDDTTRWVGLHFVQADEINQLSYCVIQNVLNTYGGAVTSEYTDLRVSHSVISHSIGNLGGGLTAMYCPRLEVDSCTIAYCAADGAGGLEVQFCDSVRIRYSSLHHNFSTGIAEASGGGGLRCFYANVQLERNLIFANVAIYRGAGLLAVYTSARLLNNTIAMNLANNPGSNTYGAGICTVGLANVIGPNNIVYFNTAAQSAQVCGTVNLTYSCVSDSLPGAGNITDDPLFLLPVTFDFHLQADSPCIDTGDPTSPLDPDGSQADMGAFYYPQTGL